jgi:signal transduction histidine kinase
MNDVAVGNLTLFKRFAAINRTITTSLDFEEVLGLIVRSGLEFVGAAACLVLLREGEGALRICAARGVDPAVADAFVGPMQESVLGEVRQFLGFAGMEGIAAAPIMSDGVVQGILVVIRNTPLNSQETWLLSALADQAAITLGNAHLHGTMISRNAELQNEVSRSWKVAQELAGLIQAVAEDLREPLRTMSGSEKLLLDESGGQPLTKGSREFLIRIASVARKTAGLIQDLLADTQLAKAELALEPVDLEHAVSEAVAGIETEIAGRGGSVRVDAPLFKVLAHRKTLAKILGNLLSNALKFISPSAAPLVEVSAERLGEFVRVSVLDNGIGIREESQGRLFRVLDQLNRAEEYPGTGIGLAIVQRGAERMGGRCGVESKAGKGSRFWIELREV